MQAVLAAAVYWMARDFNSRAIEKLIEAAEDEDSIIRAAAATALVALAEIHCVPPSQLEPQACSL